MRRLDFLLLLLLPTLGSTFIILLSISWQAECINFPLHRRLPTIRNQCRPSMGYSPPPPNSFLISFSKCRHHWSVNDYCYWLPVTMVASYFSEVSHGCYPIRKTKVPTNGTSTSTHSEHGKRAYWPIKMRLSFGNTSRLVSWWDIDITQHLRTNDYVYGNNFRAMTSPQPLNYESFFLNFTIFAGIIESISVYYYSKASNMGNRFRK